MAAGEGFTMKATVDAAQAQAALNQINARLAKTNKLLMAIHSQSRRAGGNFGRMSGQTKKASGAFSQLGGSLKGTMMQFIGLQAIMQFAIGSLKEVLTWAMNTKKAFRDFEKSIAEVSTILQGVALKRLPELSAGLEAASVKFGKSAVDMSRAMYQILSAAFDASRAMGILNVAVKASVAGLTSVETSVDVLTSVLNSYGKAASQAGQVSDVLFQTVVRGKLRFEDLASAMGYITPIAAAAGVAFEEVAAALSTVTRMGLHVDMASRGLALLIQGIVSPTNQATEAAEEYGIEMNALSLRIEGLKGFVEDLNEATKEFGSSIIPEVVRNMRSLRVVMALASEEGLKGFVEDLGLVQTAAGKTDEALAKMMNTAQTQADIVEQQMKQLERNIGDAWSGFDLWWKKTQLWWGTLFSGGDADKAVRDIEDRFTQIKASYIEMLDTTARLSGQKPLFTQLVEEPDIKNFDKIIDNVVAFDKVKEYLDVSKEAKSYGEIASGWTKAEASLELYIDEFKKEYVPTFRDGNKKIYEGSELLLKINKDLAEMGVHKQIKAREYWGHDNYSNLDAIVKDLEATFNGLNKRIAEGAVRLQDYSTEIASLQPDFESFDAAIASASEQIFNHTRNLSELSGVIRTTKVEVENLYTAFGGAEFTGKLDWTIKVAEAERDLTRATQFTNMATKYGSEFINEYNSEMRQQIKTVYDYEEAQKAATQATNEYNDALDQNRLAMMRIQLLGMKRRRGLTRGEQRQLQKLEIEGLELRIEAQKDAIDEQNAIESDGNDASKANYEQAKLEIQKFFDFQQHSIFLLSDIRDDEIRDLQDNYNQKISNLAGYRAQHDSEYKKLGHAYEIQLSLLESLTPEMEKLYYDLYGISIPESIDITLKKLKEYGSVNAAVMRGDEIAADDGAGATKKPSYRVKMSKPLPGNRLRVTSTSGKTNVYPFDSKKEMLKSFITQYRPGRPLEWKRGTDYVPETGLAMLHRGERVSPAGSEQVGGDTFNFKINVQAKVDADYDVTRLASQLGAAMQSQLTDKRGKSKYRMR